MANYSKHWEEQQLKQMGMSSMIEQSETKPDPKYGEPALEETLNNVKKTLWDVERHTHDTQSRLDKNNKSGPSHPLYKIAKWADKSWALDMMNETLVETLDVLENSSIARHSASPLETSLAVLHDSTVSFNEKTERWHDDQTNMMVKGTDPRVAAAMKIRPEPERKTVEAEIHWGATIAGFLEDISKDVKLILDKLSGADKKEKKVSAEDQLEGKAAADAAADEDEKQTGFLQGMWEKMKEKAKKSWFAENWKLILGGLLFLFAPLKWIKKLWSLVVGIYDFIMGKKTTKEDVDTQQAKVDALKKQKEESKTWDPLGWRQAKIDEEEAILDRLKKEKESGDRFGGMFGKGGFLEGFGFELALVTAGLALFGPAILGLVGGLIAGFKMIKGGIKMVTGAFKMVTGAFTGVKNFAKSFTRVKDPGKAHTQALKENAKQSKVAGTAGETGAKKTAEKVGTKGAEKAGTKAVTKTATKGVGKSLLKKIPGLGLLFGAGFAVQRAMAGDFTGAGMELASGAMSIVPGIGTTGSIAMDATLMARDMGAFKDKEEAGKELGETLNKEYKEGKKDGKALKVTTTHKKGITPMGPSESIKVHATSGPSSEEMLEKSAEHHLKKFRSVKSTNRRYGDKGMEGLLKGGQGFGGHKKAHRAAVQIWQQMSDEERKKFAEYKPEGADDKATVIPTPSRSGFKTKIPQVTEGEPSKWLPFGHDESAFKKQTSLGDRWRNFSNMMWGDGEDEETGAELPIKAVRKPARKSFRMKKTLKGVLVTSKMKKLWGESQGIYQKGKAGKRGQLRSAELDLKNKLAQGDTEEIKKVLGPELYAQMVQHSNVNDLSPAVSPDAKMNATNDIHRKNQIAKETQSGSMNAYQISSEQINNSSNDAVTMLPNPVHAQKLVETNADIDW